MRQSRWFAFLNSIAGQLLVLLILASALFLTGIFISVRAARDAPVAPPVMLFTERQIGISEMLAQIPEEQIGVYLDKLRALHPGVEYQHLSKDDPSLNGLRWGARNPALRDEAYAASVNPPSVGDGNPPQPPRRDPFLDDLANPQKTTIPLARTLSSEVSQIDEVTIYSRLPDQSVIRASTSIRLHMPPNFQVEGILVFTIVCIFLLLLWAVIFLIRPLRRLAQATNNIAKENATPQKADVAGPTELRVAALALNKMQDRIHQLIDDRTRMLAAVGHDLRTPVTRLRLRADTVEPEEVKAAFLRDLNMMDGLLKRLMTYFSKGDMDEDPVRLELSSLVDSLVSEWDDAGEAVELVGYANMTILARPNDLMRMVDNLIDNAIKYAGSCEVSLSREESEKGNVACLRVIDHGPGIAQEDKLHLLEPFERGDKARTMNDKSGFGLGLAIARKVAQMHQAALELADTDGGGLTVVVRFPIAS
nr:ATP-binding protein [uncultured Cohaesibacter sp.]